VTSEHVGHLSPLVVYVDDNDDDDDDEIPIPITLVLIVIFVYRPTGKIFNDFLCIDIFKTILN